MSAPAKPPILSPGLSVGWAILASVYVALGATFAGGVALGEPLVALVASVAIAAAFSPFATLASVVVNGPGRRLGKIPRLFASAASVGVGAAIMRLDVPVPVGLAGSAALVTGVAGLVSVCAEGRSNSQGWSLALGLTVALSALARQMEPGAPTSLRDWLHLPLLVPIAVTVFVGVPPRGFLTRTASC